MRQETKVIHNNADKIEPIFQRATFSVKAVENLADAAKTDRFYTRLGNPNFTSCESALAELEDAEAALIFPSGMAAITNAILAMVKANEHIIAQRDLYGTAYQFISEWLPRFGIEATFVETNSLEAIEKNLRPTTRLLYLESPTNPILKIVDLEKMASFAKEKKLITIIDSTFNTPINLKPLSFGINLAVHSATKYLSGHSDLMAGVIAGPHDLINQIKVQRTILGTIMDPHAAWLLQRGIRTLALRMERHNKNALRMAEFLQGHPSVEKVNYPFLPTHPQYDLACQQMKGGGGLLSFSIKGSEREAERLINGLKLFSIAPSLGGIESLVTIPALTSHKDLPCEEKQRMGITRTLIRLALGIEHIEDLIDDLKQALDSIA